MSYGKFKVGDEVRIVREISGNYRSYIGRVTTIEAVNNNDDVSSGGYSLSGVPANGWQDQELELVSKSKKGAKKMAKYYKVIKENYQFEEGAILKKEQDRYLPISDLWDRGDFGGSIAAECVEAPENADWFERVYEVGVLGKTKYLAKAAAKDAHEKLHKSK